MTSTPKEKAEELVDSMYGCAEINRSEAKQCALIAVDELIKATETVWFLDGNYWIGVKQEIEKIK